MVVQNANEIFARHIPERLKANPGFTKAFKTIVKFRLTGEGSGTWTLDLTQSPPRILSGAEADTVEASCTITVAADELVKAINGRLTPQLAFGRGTFKLAGDVGLAMKLGPLFL
jgi:hypothetical protein